MDITESHFLGWSQVWWKCLIAPRSGRINFFTLDACTDFCCFPFTFFWCTLQLEAGCWVGTDVSVKNKRCCCLNTPFSHAHGESIHYFGSLENSFQLSSVEHYGVLSDILILWDTEKYFVCCSMYCLVDSGLAIHFLIVICLREDHLCHWFSPSLLWKVWESAKQGRKYQ